MLILIVTLTINQTFQVINAQSTSTNNQWAIALFVQNGQNLTNTNSSFAPFDQVQLYANVTFGNASQPDILVSFNVTGPINSPNINKITRIETTNASGIAGFTFRLPIESNNESLGTGIWQASATIQTTNGLLQKTADFNSQWNCEITSINILNSKDENQTSFQPGDTVTALLSINSIQPLPANISFSVTDSAGNVIGQTRIQKLLGNSSAQDDGRFIFPVPNSTALGVATINAAVYSGTYQNVDIPIAQSKTGQFTIVSNGSGGSAPTPTPNTSPNPIPTPIENSVSLFSWLLVSTGFFTFTLLLAFLKRKTIAGINTQVPKMPITTLTTESQQSIESLPPKESSQETATIITVPTPKIAPEKTIQATKIEELPSIYETLGITQPNLTDDTRN